MNRFLLLSALFSIAFGAMETAMAQSAPAKKERPDASIIVKDSVYFTMDDGVMSEDEMEQEANFIHGTCAGNPYQRIYYDCDCIAGAFLQKREKLGPMTPQSDIYIELMNSPKSPCANTVAIAGQEYESCMSYAKTFRELKRDNEEYCQCVGNKTARDFAKSPKLDVGMIDNISLAAMNYCETPANRQKKDQSTAASTRSPQNPSGQTLGDAAIGPSGITPPTVIPQVSQTTPVAPTTPTPAQN